MNTVFFKEFRLNTQFVSDTADIAKTKTSRFFHNIAHLTSQQQFAFAWEGIYFDIQCFTANRSPCHTSNFADFILQFLQIAQIFSLAQIPFQIMQVDTHPFFVFFQHFTSRFAADCRQLTFQITHTRLSGIIADNMQHGVGRNVNLLFFQPVFFQLFRQQITLCNLHFFILDITCHLDNFHTVQKRLGNILQRVGSGDKQYFR